MATKYVRRKQTGPGQVANVGPPSLPESHTIMEMSLLKASTTHTVYLLFEENFKLWTRMSLQSLQFTNYAFTPRNVITVQCKIPLIQYSDQARGCTVWGSNPGWYTRVLFSKTPRPALGPPSLLFNGHHNSIQGVKQSVHEANHSPRSSA
jgi:hypothetical protein